MKNFETKLGFKKIKNIYFLILALSILYLFSCKQSFTQYAENKDYYKHLLKISKYYKHFDTTGWLLDKVFYDDDGSGSAHYYVVKSMKDTSYFLNFNFYKTNDEEFYTIVMFRKTFIDNAFKHYVYFGKQNDTLYHYKTPINDSKEKIFIIGKYLYLSKNFKLNRGQRKFFEKYRDSLSKIRGDTLPKLPSLE